MFGYRGPSNSGISAVEPTSSFVRAIMGVGFGAFWIVPATEAERLLSLG
jgi:hypothetical protein